jgi:hypothetical protein
MLRDLARRCGRLGRWERLALVLWAAALAVVSGRAAAFPGHSVYPIFSTAGRHWLAGACLYERTYDLYRYSPLIAALFAPFGLLPDAGGGVLWRCLSAAAFLGALLWWCRAVLPITLTRAQQACLLLLVLPLSLGNLNNGQSNTLVLALLLAAAAAVASRGDAPGGRWRDDLAAACVALACLFKVYPIAVGLLLVVVHPRRFGWRLPLALAAGLALPFLLQRPGYVLDQYLGWLRHLETNDRHVLPAALWYRDVQLLCWQCGVPLSSGAYRQVQALAAAACAAVCLAGRLRGWPERQMLTVLTVLGVCWMTAFGSATESATYVLMAPAAAWLVLEARLRHRTGLLRAAPVVGYGLLVLVQVGDWFPTGKVLQMLGTQPFATLLLLGTMLAALVHDRRPRLGPLAAEHFIAPRHSPRIQ